VRRGDSLETVVPERKPLDKNPRMPRAADVFRYPIDDHSVDSGMAGLDAAPTAPAPWTASKASTFDSPGRASERVGALRGRKQLNERLITLGLFLVAAAAAVAIFLFGPPR